MSNIPLHLYWEYCLAALAVGFCTLLVYSLCRLMCHCSIYGCQTRIISLLTATYLLTLCVNCLIILMVTLFHIEISLYSAFHQHHDIPSITYITGIYGVLWLNFLLNSVMIAVWCILFSDLFGMKPRIAKKIIYAALIGAILYLVIVVVVYILFEMTTALSFALYLSVLSYLDLIPIAVNIFIGFICLCKLPLSQPIDLCIGLYQRNTLCSCYTTITQYIWLMICIPVFQSILVVLIVLEIDVWNFDATNNDTFMHVITNDIAKLIYFLSQFISLVLSWNFVCISIAQSTRKKTVLDIILLDTKETLLTAYPIDQEDKDEMMTVLHSHIENNDHDTQQMQEMQELNEANHNKSHVTIKSNSVSNVLLADEMNESTTTEIPQLPTTTLEDIHPFHIFTVHDIDPEQNFQIIEPLGEGAYGPVFAALDARDQQKVALKVMTFNPDDCKDLLSEIDILQRCHSPYIVNFKDTFHKDNNIWLAMEYCDGGSILDVMKITNQHLTELQCKCVLYQAVSALVYLHSIELIHRDIKAANILVNSGGCCKLADFGVAKTMRPSGVGTTIGSPYWMAPEVISSDHYNTSADIWSLGIVAIEMAIGHPPLAHIKPMQAMLMIPKIAAPAIPSDEVQRNNLSDGILQFIAKCLKKNPQQRCSATQLLQDEWIQSAANHNINQAELIPLMNEAIPLLERERQLSAFMANQEESEDAQQKQQQEEDDDIPPFAHQPTGTFMVMPMNDEMENTFIENNDTKEDVMNEELKDEDEDEDDDEDEQEAEGTEEGTEIRHYTESSSDHNNYNDDDDDNESNSDSNLIMKF